MTTKQQQAVNEVSRFVIVMLPDSISERRKILTALIDSMPLGHPIRGSLRELLVHLDAHEKLQADLAKGKI